MGTGTGIGTLMPTWPTSISFWNLRAAAPALREDAGAVAERVVVDELDRLVERIDADDAQHRAEDFLV